MKRVLALMMILVMALSLTGCLSPEEREERKQALSALNGGSDGDYVLSTGTTLENQTLYDGSDIIVRLAGIQGTPADPELVLAVKNGSRHDIGFNVDYMTVNGWQVGGWSDLYDVETRSVALGTVGCSGDLEHSGITDVATVTLGFTIFDEDSYEDIAVVSCSMTTSAAGSVDLSYAPDGPVLLDEDGILVKAVDLAASRDGTSLSLYVENTTSREIYLETSHARLNGEPVDLWFWSEVAPDARRLLTEWLYDEDAYDDLYMTSADELTFDLNVLDWDTDAVLASQSVFLSREDF